MRVDFQVDGNERPKKKENTVVVIVVWNYWDSFFLKEISKRRALCDKFL